MESVVDFAEDSPEQVNSYATIYTLADPLATKPAKSLEDLAAQIEWCKLDLGIDMPEGDPRWAVFDILIAGTKQLAQPTSADALKNAGRQLEPVGHSLN